MYQPYDDDHKEKRYHWNTRGRVEIKKEVDQDQAFKRFISREIAKIWESGTAATCRDQTLSLYVELDQIKNLQPYMKEMITKGTLRIFQYRYNLGMLSFSDNEVIMTNRLHTALINAEYDGNVGA